MIRQFTSALVLGAAQLGFPYGIANKTGQPDRVAVRKIIQTAWDNGVREFDTAQDYGDSEKALGIAFAELGILKEAAVISKINPGLDHCDSPAMSKALDESLEKLATPCLAGLMIHNEDMLCRWANGIKDILRGFVSAGKVKKIGVSLYSPGKALEALNIEGIDMIQIPSNILDRRFERAGVYELALRKKKQVYIRSVFLQGLILMEPEDLPAHMSFAGETLDKITLLSRELNLTRHEMALGYLKEKFPEAKLVVGVDTPSQMMENVAGWIKKPADTIVLRVSECFDQVDEKILNPSLWRS
jgi:aryl-alcohol dehydrogenase-like predicted oxidoreductase